jgi:hypothetical protein
LIFSSDMTRREEGTTTTVRGSRVWRKGELLESDLFGTNFLRSSTQSSAPPLVAPAQCPKAVCSTSDDNDADNVHRDQLVFNASTT